jgi:integrase
MTTAIELLNRRSEPPSAGPVLSEGARNLIIASLAANTLKSYGGALRYWATWCTAHPEADETDPHAYDLANWAADLLVGDPSTGSTVHRKPSTVGVYVSAVLAARPHSRAAASPAALRRALSGFRRTYANSVAAGDAVGFTQARALELSELYRIVDSITDSPGHDTAKRRDVALLLVGFGAALRRSELVAMHVSHVKRDGRGMLLDLPRSKTDQTGRGATVPILRSDDPRYCPVEAWQRWLAVRGSAPGRAWARILKSGRIVEPFGLTPASVGAILTSRALQAGVDLDSLSAHSLRVGFITTAARAGVDERRIARVSRHRSSVILGGYIRRTADPFVDGGIDIWGAGPQR